MLGRFLKAANATVLGQLIARFGSFILVPMFLSHWSAAVYGEWLTLYAAVGYLSSLDVGMQAAALNRLTAAYARKDIDDYRKTQSSALSMYVVTAGLGFTLLVAIAGTMPVGRWLGLHVTTRLDAAVALVFLGGYVLWSLPGKIMIGSYQTMGRLARSQWVSNTQIAVNLVMMSFFLSVNYGMKVMAALPLLTSLVAVAFVVRDLRKNHPEIAPAPRGADWPTMKSLVKPSVMFAIITGAMLLHYQGLTLLVSVSLGGVAVAIFSVSRTLASVLRTATDTIADSIAPDICRFDAVGDKKRLAQLMTFVIGLSVCLGIAGAVSIWWEGASIVTVWTRGRLLPDPMLIRLLALVSIGQSVWVGLCVFGTATNRNRNVAICMLASNVVAITIAALLVRRYGVVAVPIGLLIGEAVACYHFLVWDSCRKCSVKYSSFAPKLWLFVLATTGLALFGSYGAHLLLSNAFSVFRWMAVGVVALTITSATSWFVWFGTDERAMVRTRVSSLLNARRRSVLLPAVTEEIGANR